MNELAIPVHVNRNDMEVSASLVKGHRLAIASMTLIDAEILKVPGLPTSGKCWYVNRVNVPHSFGRSQGAGSLILQAALKAAWEQSPQLVIVTPGGYGEDPEAQKRFYLKNGFQRTSEEGLLTWKPECAEKE